MNCFQNNYYKILIAELETSAALLRKHVILVYSRKHNPIRQVKPALVHESPDPSRARTKCKLKPSN